MSNHVSHKAVNTTSELDLNFQLEARTQRCIELETKLMGYEERCNSLIKSANCLNNEIELLKKKKMCVRRKVKTYR